MIFDTHAHYDDKTFDKDREKMLEYVTANGVEKIINVGASFKGAEDSVKLAKKYPFIYAAVGIHPAEVGELDEEKMVCKADGSGKRNKTADYCSQP